MPDTIYDNPDLAAIATGTQAPAAETPPPPPPPQEEELPTWEQIKQSPVFKQATDPQRATMLGNYAKEASQSLAKEVGDDPEKAKVANERLSDFVTRAQNDLEDRYPFLENLSRSFAHGAITKTAEIYQGYTGAVAGLVKRAEENVEPGVSTALSDIAKLTVPQAQEQLAQQDKLQKEMEPKVEAARALQTRLQMAGSDPALRADIMANAPEAKFFPGGEDEVSRTIASPGFIQQRKDLLQKYIDSNGDPNSVPGYERQAAITAVGEHAVARSKELLNPDAAFIRNHPGWNAVADSLGQLAPYLAHRAVVGALTEGAGLAPELVEGAKNAADMFTQGVDTYNMAYQGALAKIDARIKNGEDISPQARERMAGDDASKQVYGVPLMVFGHMLVGHLVEGGFPQKEADTLVNKLIENVFKPGIKDYAVQAGIGTGVAELNALADQTSGVEPGALSDQDKILSQGAFMGVAPTIIGGAGRLYHTLRGHAAEQAQVNQTADSVRIAADRIVLADPTQNGDDVQERIVKTLPARMQDSVRAKLKLKEAVDIQKEASDELAKTESPLTKEEIDKGTAETEKQSTAPPRPEAMTAEERLEAGEGIIHQALANGHITDEQHAHLIEQFEANPGETIQQLGRTLGFDPDKVTLEDLQERTKTKTPAAKPEAPTEAPKEEAAPEVAPKEPAPITPEMVAGLDPEQTGAVTKLVQEHGIEPNEAVALIKKFGPIAPTDELVSMARRLQRMQKAPKPEAAPPAPKPEEAAPPAPTEEAAPAPEVTPENNQTALRVKVNNYLGVEAMKDKVQKQEFGRDFLAQVPQQDRPAAAQLLHQIGLEQLPEGEHQNWARITPEEQGHMFALMSRFIDNRVATEGMTHAEKPIFTHAGKPVFKEALELPELTNFFQADDAEGLQNRLKAGQKGTFKENDISPEMDEWLADNGFSSDAVGTDEVTLNPSTKILSGYEQLTTRLEKKEAAEKGEVGRPLRQTYEPSEVQEKYIKETAALPEHPAENAELDRITPELDERLEADPSGQLFSQAQNRYRRQLRLWAKRMVAAGRNDDLVLLGRKTALEVELTKYDPDSSEYAAIESALAVVDKHIKDSGADKPVIDTAGKEHAKPQIATIIKSVNGDYSDWKRVFEERYPQVSLQKPLGEEGEETEAERIKDRRPISRADEDRAAGIHETLDVDPKEELPEFIKTLRTDQEKAFAYKVGNMLATLLNRPLAEVPKNLPELPAAASRKLLTRIFDEYTRFLEKRHPRARPAGEGGEEGGTPAATATWGNAFPPGHPEETALGAGRGNVAGGGETDTSALRESSSLTARNQGVVAERDFTSAPGRGTIAGYPERTGEEQAGTPFAATEPGPGPASPHTRAAEQAVTRTGAAEPGTVRRDALTGERINVTPEGTERARHTLPNITPDEQAVFEGRIEPSVIRTANRIWQEWELHKQGEGGTPTYGGVFGLKSEDFTNIGQVKAELRRQVNLMVRQEPTLQGRLSLANDILLGIPQFREQNMSASRLRRQKLYASQTTPVTTRERIREIWRESLTRFKPAFDALGAQIQTDLTARTVSVRPWSSGRIELLHNPSVFENILNRAPAGFTEGQLRSYMESAVEEELIHAAQMAWYREQWQANPGNKWEGGLSGPGEVRQRNFNEFVAAKDTELMRAFKKARDDALAKGNHKLADDLDNTLGTAVYHYFGGEYPETEAITGWESFQHWLKQLSPREAAAVNSAIPMELSRQLTQIKLSGQTSELSFRQLIHRVIDTFMSGLRHLRSIGLRISEGAMGQAWKDTINTLETRVRNLHEMLDANKPEATPTKALFENSLTLADKLGHYYINNIEAARTRGLGFEDATNGADFGNKIMAKLKARFGNDLETIYSGLHGLAVKEGLIQPSEYTVPTAIPGSKTLYAGRQASLAPGIGEEHVLDEGKADKIARFFRSSPDPEMRAFARSLTANRPKLMPVVIRQLNHDVPATFYHNGEIFVTKAALQHPDGQKAVAHELQHAVAQEILTNPEQPHEHEAAAHAHSLVDEFRANLPADIRDAADHKLPELLAHMDSSGHLDIAKLTDEERRWLPLMEASQNPSEYMKKVFSSANFRDYLRNTKAAQGGSLWDKTNDWGKTLFGNQAFKYAPEVSDITYNRPGAVMKNDPRVRNAPLSISTPELMSKFVELLNAPNKRFEQRYGVSQGAQTVLKNIANVSESSFHQKMAATLDKILERNPNITVSLNRTGNDTYHFIKNHIEIDAFHKPEHFEQAMLHEVTHALISGKVSAYLTGRMDLLTPEEKTAISELEKLRQTAVNWGIKNQHLPPEFLTALNAGSYNRKWDLWYALADSNPKLKFSYGLIDPNEFASEALSNLEFQDYLRKVPYAEAGRKPTTMWGKFIDWAKGILGFRRATPEGNAFDAVMKNLSKTMKGQRLMAADFKIEDTTGSKTGRQAALQMMTDFLERKARAEGYASLSDVPADTRNAWTENYQTETLYTGQFQPRDWGGMIAAPERSSTLTPSAELAQKTAPEDIVDHIARATGTNHLDSEGLRKAVDRAYQDKAIKPGQYIGTQDFLDHLDRHTMRYMNPLGGKDDPNSPARGLKRWFHNFLPQGNAPKELYEMKLKHIEYAANELNHKERIWVDKFNKLVRDHYVGKVPDVESVRFIPERVMEEFNKVADNTYKTMPKGMPLEMWNHLREHRAMIDGISQELLRNGIAAPESDLYLKIEKGLGAKKGEGLLIKPGRGTYISQSYRMFPDPRFTQDKGIRDKYWGPAIEPMKAHWIDVQSQEAGQKAARVYRPGTSAYESARIRAYWAKRNRLEDSVTNAQVEQHMTERLAHYTQTAEEMRRPGQTYGPAFALNDRIVTDLTHYPEEFRRLMGVERDVRRNLVNTVFQQNRYLHTLQLTKEMLEAGKGRWFADEADAAKGLIRQITPDISFIRVQGTTPEEQVRKHAIFGKLSGKWTTPEIHDFLSGYDKMIRQNSNFPNLYGLLSHVESSARYLTTILSIHRGAGNIWASNFSMIQNGMLPLDAATARAAMAYKQHLFGGTNEERNARIEEALRYGVLDKNIDQVLLNDVMRRGYKYTEYGRGPLDFLEAVGETAEKHPFFSGAKLTADKAKEFAYKFHVAGNDIAKMAQWEAKQRFLRDADDWDVKNKGTTPKTDQEIKAEAAQIVRDTNISYSLASPALKLMRSQMLVGTFLTYWNEQMRAYAQQWHYAGKYLLSKNPVERLEGVRRVAGIAFGAAVAGGLAMASRAMFGISDKRDRQLRSLLPPWEQNDTRLYLAPEKNGRLTYVNLNYIMPQGDLARGLMALLTPNPQGPLGNVLDATKEAMHPFINWGLTPTSLIDISRNQTEYGTQVYNPDDDPLTIGGAMIQHIASRWLGGTLGRLPQLAQKPGTVSPGGNIYNPGLWLGKEFGGLDIHDISIPDRFRSSLFSSSEEIKNAQRIFNGPIQHTGNIMTDGQMKSAYLHMERVRFIEFNRLHDKIETALGSGMSTREVTSMLKERGYSRSLIHDLLAGRYRSYRPGKGVLQNARANGNIVPHSLFSSSAKDYEEEED